MDLLKAKWCDAVLVESFGPTQISSGLVRSSSCDAHVTPSFSLLCVFHYVFHSSDVLYLYRVELLLPVPYRYAGTVDASDKDYTSRF